MIIIPSRKILEPNSELCLPRTEMCGFFKFEAVNKYTGRSRVLADWFPNLITTAGLNFMGGTGGYLNYCAVGTGNTAPNIADTALATQVGTRTSSISSSNLSAQSEEPYYSSMTKTFRFDEGQATGNLAEVGIFSGLTAGTLWSRALILDGLGDPTTITVLADEYLDVTYQLRWYPIPADVTGTIVIAAVSYDYIIRAAGVTSVSAGNTQGIAAGGYTWSGSAAFSGDIGAITAASPSGTQSGMTVPTNEAYSNGDFYRDFTLHASLIQGNLDGGIRSIRHYFGSASNTNIGSFQMQFEPRIPKDATKILSLVMRHSFARKTL